MITYNVPIDAQRMTIGVQGENNVREFLFDVTEWRNLTGEIGAAEMVVQRAGDSSPYAAIITMHDANTVSWVPTSTDTARAGAGRIELMWISSGQTVKTRIFDMKVDPSLDYAVPDDSLDPWASWMPNLLNADARLRSVETNVYDIQTRQTSPYNFKGAVEQESELPSSGNEINDTYYVKELHYRVTYTGDAENPWQQSSLDESEYEDELDALNSLVDNGSMYVDVMGDGETDLSLGRKFIVSKNRVEVLHPSGSSSTRRICNLFGTPEIKSGSTWDGVDISSDYFCPLGLDTDMYDLVLYAEWDIAYDSGRHMLYLASKDEATSTVTKSDAFSGDKTTRIKITNLTQEFPTLRTDGNFALYCQSNSTTYLNGVRYWLRAEKINDIDKAIVEDGSAWED